MTPADWAGVAAGVGAAGVAGVGTLGTAAVRRKGLDLWLGAHLRARPRPARRPGEPLTVFLAVCDHYEPKRDHASPAKAVGRVRRWVEEYPKLFDRLRDSAGRPPRHTFFYPQDEYEPHLVDMVAGLCRKGFGEVEIHLHHDADTAAGLRQKLVEFKTTLADRHGLLSRHRSTGEVGYGFIHGNWALDNSRPDGRCCGVTGELDVLRETGCFADFTMPSAPDRTQTRTINSIYWAATKPGRVKSHDTGHPVTAGPGPENALLMVQGPLTLDWGSRKFGVLPAVENGNLQKSQPPSPKRLARWLRVGINIPCMTNSAVVKLHTHGVHEPNQDVLLGPAMVALHEKLAQTAAKDPAFRYYYVSARELANTVFAASEQNRAVGPDDFDHRYRPNG